MPHFRIDVTFHGRQRDYPSMIADDTDGKSNKGYGVAPGVVAIILIAVIVAAPILATFAGAFSGSGAQSDFWSTNGARYITTTIMLCALVGVGVTAIGAGAAMLTALTDFPGRRYFEIALALPLCYSCLCRRIRLCGFSWNLLALSPVFLALALCRKSERFQALHSFLFWRHTLMSILPCARRCQRDHLRSWRRRGCSAPRRCAPQSGSSWLPEGLR